MSFVFKMIRYSSTRKMYPLSSHATFLVSFESHAFYFVLCIISPKKLQFNFQMHARERADHLKNGEAVTNGNSTENDTHNSIPN